MERREEALTTAEEEVWNRETVPKVMMIVSTRLPQKDLISLLLLNPWIHRTLILHPSLWLALDFHEMNNAGNRLVAALSLLRYQNVRHINLEFAQDVEDKNLQDVKSKCGNSLQNLETLNLNGCQKISDTGIEAITSICPKLKGFSIYWNVRVTDLGIMHLVRNCKLVVDLNLSGCKNITDKSLHLIADNYQELDSLNLTRCVKLTDSGLQRILLKCSLLQSLNLYALSIFTDEAYKKISLLPHLKFLDLCGAQNLTDDGLSCIANCKRLVSLNLTWYVSLWVCTRISSRAKEHVSHMYLNWRLLTDRCVRVTDVGVLAIAQGCRSLELLSLFGIVGVTDKSLEALSTFCSNTLTTLDVNGCIGIKNRSRDQLLQLFPKLECFKVHS